MSHNVASCQVHTHSAVLRVCCVASRASWTPAYTPGKVLKQGRTTES